MALGDQGSAAKWTHAAMGLAIRSFALSGDTRRPNPAAVLKIVERLLREGDARQGQTTSEIGPGDAVALLGTWLRELDLGTDERELLRMLQDQELTHRDLYRRARRIHERRLAETVERGAEVLAAEQLGALPTLAGELFEAAVPAIPYAAAGAFLHREQSKLTRSDSDPVRVAIVGDGLGAVHGVTRTLQQVRERGVPGFEVEVIGTDAGVDRRLSSVTELQMPFYDGLTIGVPSLTAVVDALSEGRYDLVHVCTPGPAGVGAWALGRVLEMPVVGSYHTELAAYTALRSGRQQLGGAGRVRPAHLLRRLCGRALAERGERRAAGRAGNLVRADRPVGPRRRGLPVRARAADRRARCPARSTSSTAAG